MLALSLVACQLQLQEPGKTAAPPSSGTDPSASPPPAAEAQIECPSDLSTSAQGPVSLDKDPSRDPASYDAMRFVPEHRKPILGDATFALSARAAVDKVVALEQASPQLVPAGFRDELASHRADAAFRLRMAACEMKDRTLQRRAAIDLGLALLLGADDTKVAVMADDLAFPPECRKTSTHLKEREEVAARDACQHELIRWADYRQKSMKISAAELDIEDALSRGLASLTRPRDEGHSAVGALLFRLGHKCAGAKVCLSQAHKVGNELRFVHWDRRDGGSGYNLGPSAAQAKSNKRCKDATGWESQESCLQACWSGGRTGADGATCRTRCLASCDPHD
jgi:hypothetical protein